MEKADVKQMAISLAVIFFIVTGCNNKPATTDISAEMDTMINMTDTSKMIDVKKYEGCLAYTKNNDTVFLSLAIKNGRVSGRLVYNLYEKDKNTGGINGAMHGDTLLADYSFLSEGSRSVRQVIFLKKGNILQEGIGGMKEQGSRLVFTNTAEVSFNDNIFLEPVDCNSFHNK